MRKLSTKDLMTQKLIFQLTVRPKTMSKTQTAKSTIYKPRINVNQRGN